VFLDDLDLGDVVFIDPKCVHGWSPNTDMEQNIPRVALRLHMKSGSALESYRESDIGRSVQYEDTGSILGWVKQLLTGWTPLHPRLIDECTSPQVWPLTDRDKEIITLGTAEQTVSELR